MDNSYYDALIQSLLLYGRRCQVKGHEIFYLESSIWDPSPFPSSIYKTSNQHNSGVSLSQGKQLHMQAPAPPMFHRCLLSSCFCHPRNTQHFLINL